MGQTRIQPLPPKVHIWNRKPGKDLFIHQLDERGGNRLTSHGPRRDGAGYSRLPPPGPAVSSKPLLRLRVRGKGFPSPPKPRKGRGNPDSRPLAPRHVFHFTINACGGGGEKRKEPSASPANPKLHSGTVWRHPTPDPPSGSLEPPVSPGDRAQAKTVHPAAAPRAGAAAQQMNEPGPLNVWALPRRRQPRASPGPEPSAGRFLPRGAAGRGAGRPRGAGSRAPPPPQGPRGAPGRAAPAPGGPGASRSLARPPARPPARSAGRRSLSGPAASASPPDSPRPARGQGKDPDARPEPVRHPPLSEQRAAATKPSPPPPPPPATAAPGAARTGPDCVTRCSPSEARSGAPPSLAAHWRTAPPL
ncbi:basic proline-rich protein-like [Sorex araneus]|uniref:basic proline-rich protein-like n=1 Tax=Sorex araneus TaxID=42254 RepID=UPI0024336036|nr:basic proline-rich protein-like [Sorex araneus]